MNVLESILLAVDSVRMNKLRAILTLLSVSIGVFAIIGANGLVSSIENAVNVEIQQAGAHSFSIYRIPKIQMGRHQWRKYRKRKAISYSQYKEFKERMTGVKMISGYSADGGYTVKYKDKETNPDITLFGSDENFLESVNVDVVEGRNITAHDLKYNKRVAVIGPDIVVNLFPNVSPLGKEIKMGSQIFTVIGILESKGAIFGQSQDNRVLIPLTYFLRYYASWWDESLTITVKAFDKESVEYAFDEAIGIMRILRDVKPWQDNNFEIETNESMGEKFESFTNYLSVFGWIVGAFALIAAGVGIMNIMLVTVKERTKEIGVRKAVGAKNYWILFQFIIEAVTLCLLGGGIGIVLGLLASAYFGSAMGLVLSIPLNAIVLSVVFCTFIGVAFGAYPAWKAAKLDPIDALRYE